MEVVGLGVLLGLDNMRVAAGLAAAGVSGRRALSLAVAFGLAETAMPVVGLAVGSWLIPVFEPWTHLVGAACLGICAVYVLREPDEEMEAPDRLAGSGALLGLPIALGLDNLSAGAGLGVLGMPVLTTALTLGLLSTLMCLSGFALGALAHRSLGERARLVGGMALMLLAILTAFDL